MRFKEWVRFHESGHIIFDKPQTITVMSHGKPTPLQGVTMIDPRFEYHNIPPPPESKSRSPKFLGDVDFSLPLVGPQGNVTMYIVSHRHGMMTGDGATSMRPEGFVVPDIHWADKAEFVGADGNTIDMDGMGRASQAG